MYKSHVKTTMWNWRQIGIWHEIVQDQEPSHTLSVDKRINDVDVDI